ncbi:IS1634 family transposase [Glutamicibacter halophytocola]|uniref:IS1634 family transposase n=1 Tax=Glutamicibacter halophytocola TaxID=1933880 RepID=UPI0015C52CB0|nr:IS1634 family transposase [Glutamicibacter halophytocola]NQD39368.1 IS1634 family transposase [Glutamicibacter halophytocola]
MGSRFIRKVRTASGAIAVQIVEKNGRTVTSVEHLGSASTDQDLAILLTTAKEQLLPGQDTLDFNVEQSPTAMDDIPNWTAQELPAETRSIGRPRSAPVEADAKVIASPATILWEVLDAAYDRLGFNILDDAAFKAMVLARLIEPTSKAQSIWVLQQIDAPHPSLRTLFRSLGTCIEKDYCDQLAKAMVAYRCATAGLASLVMYDVTTLHFEAKDEDKLRKVGMSKERRVDPQIQVGLLVDPAGFPLELHMFEGNKAETTTIIPVLQSFQERHGITDLVVVADAGMLSANNLNAIEDAGFRFIVGSRLTKAPYDLQEHFDTKGNRFTNGQTLESARVMGTGKNGRERRIVYQWSAKRFARDNRNINLMERKALAVAEGKSPMKKVRFLKVTGAEKELDEKVIERARMLAGLKGYVTNLPLDIVPATKVIGAYRDLWQVEASFRMTKSDLRARPIFHREKDSIDAHLTVVFAALAIGRHLQELTGLPLKRLITDLKAVRSAKVLINGQVVTFAAQIPEGLEEVLSRLRGGY